MPKYNYQAIDKNGRKSQGVIEANSEPDAKSKLKNQDFIPIKVGKIVNKEIINSSDNTAIKKKDLSYICRNLSVLLESGVDLERAIYLVSKISKKNNIKSALLSIHSDIIEGKKFSESVRKMGSIFPSGFSIIIESGEATGRLDQALVSIADYTDSQAKIASKIKLALLYPAILTLISTAIIIFMLTYILPEVLSAFKDTEQPLPAITSFFLLVSNFITEYGLIILAVISLAVIGIKKSLEKDINKEKMEMWFLKIPFFSEFYIKSCTAKFAGIMTFLIKNNVELLESLRISRDLSESLLLKKEMLILIEKLKEGENFGDVISSEGVIDDLFVEMLIVGEVSGNLEKVLSVALKNYEEDLERSLNYVVGIFEPMIITIVGGIIMLIVFAILQPILTINQIAF